MIMMTTEDKIIGRKYAAWLNLFIGIYNVYLFGIDFNIFNIVIGSLNIGVWVFFRKGVLEGEDDESSDSR